MKGKVSESKRSRSRGLVRRSARKTPPPVAVVVTFRHVEPTPAIRQYAERKLNHVAARLKRGCSVHLILSIDKYRHQGEVTVKSGRFAMTAREETKDLYAVIDLLADKVSRQLKTNLAKVEARRVRAASTGEIMAAVEDSTRETLALGGLGHF
jgi:ribosomal subunit interface protein